MKMINTLFFPGTKPDKELFLKVNPLLGGVIFYSLVKDEVGEKNLPGGWYSHVPVPLGPEKERFTRMVNDLRINQADYYSGLIATLSESSKYDTDESSVWKLISRLHHGDRGAVEEQMVKDKLWQARLVLSLADILTEEMRDVDSGLADVSRKEKELFKALHGDYTASENLARLRGPHKALRAGHPVSDDILMAAWGTLYALDEKDYDILLTDCESCAGLFFDRWSAKADSGLLKVFETGLADDEDVAEINGYSEVLKNLRTVISGPVGSGTVAGLRDAGTKYQNIIADNGIKTTSLLEMYLLTGCSAKEVFARISGVKPISIGHDSFLVGVVKQC